MCSEVMMMRLVPRNSFDLFTSIELPVFRDEWAVGHFGPHMSFVPCHARVSHVDVSSDEFTGVSSGKTFGCSKGPPGHVCSLVRSSL